MPTLTCNSCGYSLTGVPPHSPTEVRCPECGVWQAPAAISLNSGALTIGVPTALLVLGIGFLPLIPGWWVLVTDNGWGQLGALMVLVPAGSALGSLLAATALSVVRIRAPLALSRRLVEWTVAALCALVVNLVVGSCVGVALYAAFMRKGGC